MEQLIKRLKEMREEVANIKWVDLRCREGDELVVEITKLKILLDDMIGIMRIRKNKDLDLT
jgi:hypothetical protein